MRIAEETSLTEQAEFIRNFLNEAKGKNKKKIEADKRRRELAAEMERKGKGKVDPNTLLGGNKAPGQTPKGGGPVNPRTQSVTKIPVAQQKRMNQPGTAEKVSKALSKGKEKVQDLASKSAARLRAMKSGIDTIRAKRALKAQQAQQAQQTQDAAGREEKSKEPEKKPGIVRRLARGVLRPSGRSIGSQVGRGTVLGLDLTRQGIGRLSNFVSRNYK